MCLRRYRSVGLMTQILQSCTQLFGFAPISVKPWVYLGQTTLWLGFLAVLAYRIIYWYNRTDDNSIKIFVEVAFYMMQIVTNTITVIESYVHRRDNEAVEKMYRKVLNKMHNDPDPRAERARMFKRINRKLGLIYAVSLASFWPQFWSSVNQPNWRPFFWYSLISEQALRVRLLQLISCLMIVSDRLDVLRGVLEKAAERIWKQTTCSVWMPSTDEECKLVVRLRSAYDQFYDLSLLLNDCYGWSILAIAATYCFEFVSKAYRIFTLLQDDVHQVKLVAYSAATIGLAVFITTICWLGQDCFEKSRCIGCSICKLSKPMGNKRYNDLVNEFALQALHQSFSVTAKDFFVLNLDLLRGMAGAIVTYLVILIQFMFTERSGSKITVPNSSVADALAIAVTKNQTSRVT